MREIVLCPQCGKQEHRGFIHDRDVPKFGLSRHVDPKDERCPKCGSECVPMADGKTVLAHHVAIHAAEYPFREQAAITVREARRAAADNVLPMIRKKKAGSQG